MTETEKRKSDFEEILTMAIIVIACFFVFTYFLTVVLGPAIFFFTQEGITASSKFMSVIPVWLFVVVLFYIPVTANVGVVFLFLAGVFFVCLFAAYKFREGFHNVIRKGASRPVGKLFNNFLVVMPIITSMLLIAFLVITSLQSSVGVETEPPPGMVELPRLLQLFIANYDALIEEIAFRISPIGLFLIIHVFVAQVRNGITLSNGERLKLFFAALTYPDRAKKTVGLKTVSDFGKSGISRGEWIMIFLTSFAWGIAHVLVGSWTIGKIPSVFVNGLVFGLTYIAYGAYAPILLHWFFNYYSQVLFDISLEYYPYLLPISELAALLTLAIGIAGWIAFATMGVKKLLKLKARPSETLPLPPPPPPDQSSITVDET